MNTELRKRRKGKKIFIGLVIVGLFFLLVALLQVLWNNLMPEIFGLRTISYWQSLGLLVLSKILFGGGFGRPGGGFRRKFKRDRTLDSSDISEEDKEKLREEWRRRFDSKCRF